MVWHHINEDFIVAGKRCHVSMRGIFHFSKNEGQCLYMQRVKMA
jgi:hypothetical protein